VRIDVQILSNCSVLPDNDVLIKWVDLATAQRRLAELVIRLVDEEESAELNETYRQKKGPTNVLSFPFEMPEELPSDAISDDILGDLVICAPVVAKEAKEQGKSVLSHWAHMVIHGCLHLQGYDHVNEDDALVMEAIEIDLLSSIGINNPYEN
jgi:probable rRNA maturation factor